MNLLMVSGDRSILAGKRGAFWHTLEAFHQEWDRIDILCPHAPGMSGITTCFGNVTFHPNPRGLATQHRWIRARGQKIVESARPAVMTVHDYPPFYNGIGAARLARDTGLPYVLEIHHIVGYPRAATPVELVGRWMSRAYLPSAAKRAAGIRAVSKATAETLIRWGVPKTKVHVVPSFYLDRALYEHLSDPPSLQYDAVFCGRLVANKGVPGFLKAMARLPRVRLLVIGDGPDRAKFEKLARTLGIAHRTEFRGWLPSRQDVLKAIRSARVLLMNSTSEGGPRVPLEAMACGVPVIVTRVGVMPDVVEDGVNGLFTNGKPDDLAAKIQHILGDDALGRRMGEQAKAVLDRYERTRLIALYAHFLRSFA